MFDLHSVTITNFRSYLGEHRFEFPKVTGLYFLTGQNLAEPALGANGSGKSTLLDATTWALFGRTTRGLKANEVLSWGAASCQVSLDLTVGADRYTIHRSQKPNSLLLDGNPVDQDELQKHIRLNFDSFLASVINTQFGKPFLSLSPSEKLTLFSDIMNLNLWLEKSDEASKLAQQKEAMLKGFTTTIAQQEGQLIAITEDLEAYIKAVKEFDLKKEHDLQQIKSYIKELKSHTLLENLPHISEKLQMKLDRAERTRDYWLDDIVKASRERAKCSGELKAINEQIESFKGIGDDCPVCRQQVSKITLGAHLTELIKKETRCVGEIAALDEDIEMYKRQLVKQKNLIGRFTDELNAALDQEEHARTTQNEIKQWEQKSTETKNAENSYVFLVQNKKERLKDLKTRIAVNEDSKQQIEVALEVCNFWVKGFKRIRLFIIEQAFRTLELEINNSLAQLGMTDWQITFDIERENKSGGITKGFVTFVESPRNAEPVRWENWSGGETQRLQLAGDLGLANLIMQQHGLTNTTEFFDEPSTHLSTEGMLDLADMLHERAISESKRIWIVDHTSITNFGEFEGIITIRKDKNGSSIT